MQKKFLAVLLAVCLVLAFSSIALAADFSVKATVDEGKYVEQTQSDKTFTFYTDADKVDLKFSNITEGYSLFQNGAVTEQRDFELTGELKLSVGPTPVETIDYQETEAEDPVEYTFKLVKIAADDVVIETALYNGNSADATAYDKESGKFLVPCNVTPYVKITVSGAAADAITVTGADKPNEAGYAALKNFDDFTTSATVAVKIGSKTVASKSFDMLRPTLSKIYFNGRSTNSGRNTLTNHAGDGYEFSSQKYMESDWDPLYYKVLPLCEDKATVSVKRGNTPVQSTGSGWYGQNMSGAPYKLTVTITVGEEKTVSQKYTVYLMEKDYSGPTVKSFKANEKSGGKGDEYLTVVDKEAKTVYIFLPEGVSDLYVSATVDGEADDTLKLAGNSIEEGKWYERTATNLNGKKLTFQDVAGIEYSYKIVVNANADEHETDASLKTLKVRSGSKSSTADTVDIDFDPEVLEYAFPVDKNDVYLKLEAAAKDSDATVFINDQMVSSITVEDLDTAAVTEFKILVVAGDNVTTKTYTVTVNGSTGLLQTLSASNTKGLTPSFNTDVNTYTAYTNAGIVSTNIIALAKNFTSDYVQISKANFNDYGQVKSYTALTKVTAGGASVTADLSAGSNIFRVDVLGSATATSAKGSYYMSIYVPAADPKCVVSSQKLYVNGKEQTLSAYNIAGNNYLKLRDVAALLDGTVKEMNVDWDAAKWTATMAMPGTFTKRGDELTALTAPTQYAISTQFFTYNTKPVFPLAYNVTGSGDATGSNYVMLRDVASLLDFGVTYNATSKAIYIDTASEYTPGL